MVARSGSLAAQLADLGNAAPAEYDLDSDTEALDAGRGLANGKRQGDGDDDDGDADADAEEEARNHARHNLVDVERSQMRRRANLIENADDDTMDRYRGVKATRRQMMDSEDEEDEEEYSESDIASEDDGPEYSDAEDDDEDEDIPSDSEDDAEEDSESEGSEVAAAKPKKPLRFAEAEEPEQSAAASLKATQADAALLADLRQRSREEAARGRDTKRQLDAWGRLLGARIRVQKVVRGATRISSKAMARAAQEQQEDDDQPLQATQTDVLATLDAISGHLSALQHRLLQAYAAANDAGSASVASALDAVEPRLERAQQQSLAKGKRKLSDTEYDEQLSALFAVHDSVLGPMWRDVLGKWSWRTASTSALDDMKKAKTRFDAGAGGNGAAGLKAVNQSPEEQIRRGLEGEAFERLRKRTRVWRGTDKESRIVVNDDDVDGNDEDDDDDQEDGLSSRKGAEDADIFDDSDFYSALLRELIDSKGGGGGAGGSAMQDAQGQLAWAQAANRAAKKHRANVDRKASKGRRLRYDVNEKVQNFMPPIPRETWSEEQIHRLVEQLRSANGAPRTQNGAPDDGGDERQEPPFALEKQAVAVEMDGFRLF